MRNTDTNNRSHLHGGQGEAGGLAGVEGSLLALHGSGWDRDFRRRALLQLLGPYLPESGRALDVGCGTGYFSMWLARRGFDVVALEPSPQLARFTAERISSEHLQVQVVEAGVEGLAGLGVFDAILCLDVLEHLEDDRAALAAIHVACANNAVAIVVVPAMPSLYGTRDREIGHRRRYGKAQIADRLREANLLLIRCQYWNLIGVLPYLIASWLSSGRGVDVLRSGNDSLVKKLLRSALMGVLSMESGISRLPFGLSLMCIARPMPVAPCGKGARS